MAQRVRLRETCPVRASIAELTIPIDQLNLR